MKNITCGLALAAALLVPTGAAVAQDPGLTANFGEINLRAGFTPDPYRVSLTAGGSLDAYTDTPLPAACVGNISQAPDFEVTYSAGSLPLVFRTVSSRDTTLVINGPDGRWSCDDDSFGDGDAEVRYNRPQSGTYDIWVGTFGGGTAPATLLITETP
ncbi:peptidase S1 [uncultured Brevundimonas sp.]|uniref:peptidase S1 n=1 Tax=uncultured Brevundimonas sp. TaxID=213418 RepID=UPI0030EF7EA8|tara:strand:+ start:45857 stop:46327 length:471 start_codon:yes stop_codon:yes gene_type:complete